MARWSHGGTVTSMQTSFILRMHRMDTRANRCCDREPRCYSTSTTSSSDKRCTATMAICHEEKKHDIRLHAARLTTRCDDDANRIGAGKTRKDFAWLQLEHANVAQRNWRYT